MVRATWKSVGEQLDTADEALFSGRKESAYNLYLSLLTQQEIGSRRIHHFLYRRYALGCTAIGRLDEADRAFGFALEISLDDSDRAKVFHDQAESFVMRQMHTTAAEHYQKAIDAYSAHRGDRDAASTVVTMINDKLAQTSLEAGPDWPGHQQPIAADTVSTLMLWPDTKEEAI